MRKEEGKRDKEGRKEGQKDGRIIHTYIYIHTYIHILYTCHSHPDTPIPSGKVGRIGFGRCQQAQPPRKFTQNILKHAIQAARVPPLIGRALCHE